MVALFYLLSVFTSTCLAFSFSAGPLSQCDDLTVEWLGGTGPFQLLIVPVFGTPRNVSIPDSAFSSGKGAFSIPLQFAKDQRIVLTMSDSTGFGAGGTSEVLTVDTSRGGSCDSSDPGVAFLFRLPSPLQQCRPFVFSDYPNASQPVTIWMVIPGGTSVIAQPPRGSTSYTWVANAAAGTSMIFMMTDSRGAHGGASDIWVVGASDDSSCLNDRSPSSTMQPTSTSAKPAQSTTTSGSNPSASTSAISDGVPISAIAGTVIGSLLFLAVIVTLGLFFLKSLKKKSEKKSANADTAFGHARRIQSDGNFFGGRPPYSTAPPYYPHSPGSAAPLENPFSDSSHPDGQFAYQNQPDPFGVHRPFYPPSPVAPPPHDPFNPVEAPTLSGSISGPPSEAGQSLSQGTTSTQQKAGMAGISSYTPSRFIVHTDVEDELPPPNQDGVVELPPQYAERPRPVRKFSIANPSPRSPSRRNTNANALNTAPSSNPSPFP